MSKHTSTKTPIKVIYPLLQLSDICRLCNLNVKILGRGRYNIFQGTKSLSEKLAERLSVVVGFPVVEDVSLSSIICSKCKRTFEKLEKAASELQSFKDICSRSAKQQYELSEDPAPRFKRCNRDSPSNSTVLNQKKKLAKTGVKRSILGENITQQVQEGLNIHDDLIVHPNPPKIADVEVRINS